jgi:adenylate cyclase
MSATRRLAAILAADVAGYSRLKGQDEPGTLQAFKTIRSELFDPTIGAHNRRLVKTTGDRSLSSLPVWCMRYGARLKRGPAWASVTPKRRAARQSSRTYSRFQRRRL